MRSLIIIVAILLECTYCFARDFSEDGKYYKQDLIAAIAQADRIVVTEHSDESDFYDSITGTKPTRIPFYEYGRVELKPSQKADFLTAAKQMSEKMPEWYAMCAFQAHHTIYFYSGTTLKSTMKICYHCGQIQWDGSKKSAPEGIFGCLTPTIKKCGFETERNWHALAKQ